MKNENILKSSYDSLIHPKNKLKNNINNRNRNSDNYLSMTKLNVITDEEEQKYNRKTVKFITNNIYSLKKYKIKAFHSPKINKKKSSFNKIRINSMKTNENNENEKCKNFFEESINNKQLENLKTMNNLPLKNNEKNSIDKPNKTISNSSNKINYNLTESSKTNKIVYPLLNSSHKNDKCISLENNHKVKNKISSNKTLFDDKSKTQTIINNKEKINFQSNLFPISINTTTNENIILNSIHNKTDNNFYLEHKKKPKYYNIKLTKHNNNNIFASIFKEYQKKMEPSFSIIKNKASNISKDIESNPFMRKIENLNDINKFEIVFHKSIMENITEIQQNKRSGFFRGEVCGVNINKNKTNGCYVSESKSNIFNITEMIDKMHPFSCVKFNKLLRKDYKEFLGNKNNFLKKQTKKEDKLRKVAIKRYHRELFFENEIADKYNIKKNQNIKFIEDEEVGIHKIQSDF